MKFLEKQNILEIVYVKKEMPEVLYRNEVLDGVNVSLIYDYIKKELYHLKGNSETIWKLIDGVQSVKMIIKKIKEDNNVQHNLIEKDVIKTIVKFGRKGLIKFAYK